VQPYLSHRFSGTVTHAHIGTYGPLELIVEGPAVSPTGTAGPSLACPAIPFLLVGEGRLAGLAHPSVVDDLVRIMKHGDRRVKECSGTWQAN
jgi:hypothetical protein